MKTAAPEPGVYADLASLIALQYEARGFSFLPRQPIHSLLSGRHASRLRGRGLDFEEIRRYQPGDDVRQIDWKVTLRTRKTHCRIYTEERERSVLIVVDQRRSMFFGSVRYMKSVIAAQAAAFGVWRVIAQKDRIGALVFNDSTIDEIRPQRSRASAIRILSAIARHNCALSSKPGPASAPAMFNRALTYAARLATHDFLVCVITDGSGANAESRDLLTRIAHHNDVILGFVFDPLEADLPDIGPLVFSDGSSQLEVDTSRRGFCEKFRGEFAQIRAMNRKFLLQRETPVLPLDTTQDAARQFRRSLGAVIR
jgi:uncharacterized protein (DUF58 family)